MVALLSPCTGHCLDMIRQQLMCTVDINVFGQVWVDSISGPFPDVRILHTAFSRPSAFALTTLGSVHDDA